jgi:hypothetical protein
MKATQPAGYAVDYQISRGMPWGQPRWSDESNLQRMSRALFDNFGSFYKSSRNQEAG